MSKRIGLTVVAITLILAVQAQQKFSYPEVDKKSYELFQQKQWEDLIDFSNEARNNGIDFFYLKVRTGIALYNLQKYRPAAEWFLQAWEKERDVEWLQEYLYYSLVFGGRTTEALKIAVDFSPGLKKKIGYSNSKISRLAIEGGYSFNPDFEELLNADHDVAAGVGDDYGEAFYLKNYHFESFDLSHQVTPGFSLNHNFTFIGLNRRERIDWGNRELKDININQFQYFLSPHFVIGKKIYASPSVSAIWGSYEFNIGGFDNNQNRSFYPSQVKYSDFIFSTSVWSHFGNFSPGAEVNFANINDGNFTQLSAWLTFYPLSNTNFYIAPRFYFKSDENSSLSFNTFGISGGLQLGTVHLYGSYLNGDMENFIESAGYVVANFPGTSQNKFSGSLYFPTGKKYQLVIRYINQDITENYRVYTSGIESDVFSYNYMKHTFTGGISWNF